MSVQGQLETKILELPDEENFEAYIVKPSGVLKKDAWVLKMVMVVMPVPSIRVDELGAAMVDLGTVGDEKKVWDNADLVTRGREILRQTS